MYANRSVLLRALLLIAITSSVAACSTDDASDPGMKMESFRSHPSADLELHWSFEARDGSTIYDLSGNNRDGTLEDGSFVNSPWGEAVSLDGIDDYISFVGPRDPSDFGGASSGAFTISARVLVDDADRYNTLCYGCAPNAVLSLGTSSFGPRLYGSLYKPSTSGKTWPMSDNPSVSDATWTTVTMVVEAGVATNYYIDCEHDRTVSETDSALHDYSYSAVGEGFNSSSYFDGMIDDLKVWSGALSASEISGLCPCGGAPEADTLGIEPPRAPAPYDSSGLSGTLVDTTEDLQTEVTNGTAVIILDDGTYTPDDLTLDYLKLRGQQLWAKNSGEAILKFGIETGGNNQLPSVDYRDSELHGLVFDIDDETHTPDHLGFGYIVISNWGDAIGLVMEDCVLHGNSDQDYGILSTSYDASNLALERFIGRRLEIDAMTAYGIHVEGLHTNPAILEDVRVWDIVEPMGGTGIRMSETATVNRVHIRDVRWAGLVPNGQNDGSTYNDIDIDRVGVGYSTGGMGIYLDNTALDVTVNDFCVGPNTRIGVNSEWDQNNACVPGVDVDTEAEMTDCLGMNPGFFSRAADNTIQDGLVESSMIGVHFDRGTVAGDVTNVTFRSYTRSAITFYDTVGDAADWPWYDDGSTQSANTFEECGICGLSYDHWNTTNPTCEDSPPPC